MAATVSKAGPYYSSGEIKFSSLRSNFRAQLRKETYNGSETFNSDSSPIKASELRRITSTSNETSTVPDATENANISTGSNWKTSQFRNSIKFYYIAQTGTDTNFDIAGQSWNGNLNKNIRKIMFMVGTCGSNAPGSPAASSNSTSHNLTIDVYGGIYGASGRGGGRSGAPAISGENGGDALQFFNNGNGNRVLIRSGSNVYGAGGGGERGRNGDNGSTGRCINYSQYNKRRCGSCPGCDGGDQRIDCYNRQGRCSWTRQFHDAVCRRRNNNDVAGGPGGTGGLGGPGRGYNYSGDRAGDNGTSGSGGGCSGYNENGSPVPTRGKDGEKGGDGGDWGNNGENTNNTGNGGETGRAIRGDNYSVTGTVDSSTVRGAYNP